LRDWVFRCERAKGHSGPWHVRDVEADCDDAFRNGSALCGEYLPHSTECDSEFEDALVNDGIDGVLCESCQKVGERRTLKRKREEVMPDEIVRGVDALLHLPLVLRPAHEPVRGLSHEETAHVVREILAAARP
jgi:hypothetical protein